MKEWVIYAIEVAMDAPFIPNRGIRRKSKIIVTIRETNDAKLLYCGKPRPTKSEPKTLLILKKKIPGRRNFKAVTEGRNREVNNQGIIIPEILYKIKTATKVNRTVLRQTKGVNLLALSLSEEAIFGYNI